MNARSIFLSLFILFNSPLFAQWDPELVNNPSLLLGMTKMQKEELAMDLKYKPEYSTKEAREFVNKVFVEHFKQIEMLNRNGIDIFMNYSKAKTELFRNEYTELGWIFRDVLTGEFNDSQWRLNGQYDTTKETDIFNSSVLSRSLKGYFDTMPEDERFYFIHPDSGEWSYADLDKRSLIQEHFEYMFFEKTAGDAVSLIVRREKMMERSEWQEGLDLLDKLENNPLTKNIFADCGDEMEMTQKFVDYIDSKDGVLGKEGDIALFGEYTDGGRNGGLYDFWYKNSSGKSGELYKGLLILFGALCFDQGLSDVKDISTKVRTAYVETGVILPGGTVDWFKIRPQTLQKSIGIMFKTTTMEKFYFGSNKIVRM